MKKFTAEYFLNKISSAEKREDNYIRACADTQKDFCAEKHFNILFSNTDLLLGALTSNNPKPVIKVRFPKQNTQNLFEKNLANTVGEIVERAVIFNNDNLNFKEILEELVQAALLFGRGVCFLSYEPEFETNGEMDTEIIKSQAVKLKAVDFEDFRFGYAKTWDKVPWVAVRHLMDKKSAEKKFGELAKELNFSYKDKYQNEQQEKAQNQETKLACIWEFWDKNEKKVAFVSPGCANILSLYDDPYELDGFFPMVEPLRFIALKGLEAIPEYKIYRKSALALERVEKRIDALTDNIRANAVACAKDQETLQALQDAADSEIVSVQTPDIAAAGGLNGVIMEYPNEGKMKVLGSLLNRKNDLQQTIYGITGISDILRGETDARETAAAQNIKGKFGSLRLQKRQAKTQEFIRKIYQIITDIICEHFTADTLKSVSSIELPSVQDKALAQLQIKELQASNQPVPKELTEMLQKPTWDDVINAMRENGLRSYIIEVESTATAFDDEAEDKSARQNLFSAITSTLQTALPTMAANPVLINLYKQLINFWLDGFKYSRALKESVNEAFNAFEEQVKAPKNPPQPTPELLLAQAEQVKAQADMLNAQTRAAEAQVKAQQASEKLNIDKAELVKNIKKDAAELDIERQKMWH